MALFFNNSLVDFGSSVEDIIISSNTIWGPDTVKHYRSVTINSNIVLTIHRTCDFRVNNNLYINGTISSYKSESTTSAARNGTSATWGSWTGGNGNACWGGGGGASISSGFAGGACSSGAGFNNQVMGQGGTGTGSVNLGVTNWTDIIGTNYVGGKGAGGNHSQSGNNSGGNDTDGTYGASPLKILAKNIIFGNNGKILAEADNASSASWGDDGTRSRGAGGGGGGGVIWVIAENETGSGTYSTKGGSGGGNACNLDQIGPAGGGAGGNGAVRRDIANKSLSVTVSNASIFSDTVVISDTAAPTINTPVLSFPNGAGANQNQIVTVSIIDTQTSVSNPTAVFQTVTGTNNGTVTLTSFNSGTAIFTISNQTGNGSARLRITAVDAAGNSATADSPVWAIDNSPPSGYVPFFGNSTTDWILDGSAVPGLTYYPAYAAYTIDSCNSADNTYIIYLRNLQINAGYALLWCGALTLIVNNESIINGRLGWTDASLGSEGSKRGGGGAGGLGGTNQSYSVFYPNNDLGYWGGGEGRDWPAGVGWNSQGTWTTVTYAGDTYGCGYNERCWASSGGGGNHQWKVPNASDSYQDLLNRGVAVGSGGGGGGRGNAGSGGNGGWGGPAIILKTQKISGTGTINVSGAGGDYRYDTSGLGGGNGSGAGGAGGGGHAAVIAGTSNFSSGSIYATGGGYISYYYNSGSVPLTVSPEIINTNRQTSIIPATIADNQPSVTSALLTSAHRKNGQVQRISISYSKTMTDNEVKITLSGATTLAPTVMNKAASPANTYYYDHTSGAGNGTINYSIAAKDNVLNPAATISGSWILDNIAPSFSSAISPNRAFFMGGESISYTITGTEENIMAAVPSASLVSGSEYFGQTPPAVVLATASSSGSSYTYNSAVKLPLAIGSISATVSGYDAAGNTGTASNLSSLKLLPISGMIWS